MAPNADIVAGPEILEYENKSKPDFKTEILWKYVTFLTLLHLGGLYGIFSALLTEKAFAAVLLFVWCYSLIGAFGITAGAHRLYTHKSYKAKLPLHIMLVAFNCIAGQDSVIVWARDHRIHHKYSETDADPYNIKRGLFFAHMGWLMCKKHPMVKEKGKTVDMSDLEADPVLRFQKKYYVPLFFLFSAGIPLAFGVYVLNMSVHQSLFELFLARYLISLHITWTVNSLAHHYGSRPYDKNMGAAENSFVATMSAGEGWHNYHHVFPWDYKAGELSGPEEWNFSTSFIQMMEKIGWAYDLKIATDHVIEERRLRTGEKTC